MQNFEIVKEIKAKKSFRVSSVMGTFDLQTNNIKEKFVGKLDINEDWEVGLIVGTSGTGKTTIAKELFKDSYFVNYKYSVNNILDDMPKDCNVGDICKMFNSVGFSSPPSWLKPYHVLSNGEKMRVDLARCLLEKKKLIVFDEFTSVVDRNVAKIGSYTVQKNVRKNKKKFIAISCHHDVEKWLMPDWVFDTNEMKTIYNKRRYLQRPKINIEIYSTKEKTKYWNIFKKYHYLNHEIHKGADVFILTVNNIVCGFSSVLPFPHPKLKNAKRGHRTVVLPDYQGIGLGMILSDFVADYYISKGKTYISTTSAPSMINYRKNSKNWICTRVGRTSNPGKTGVMYNENVHLNKSSSYNRITTSWRYVK